MRIAMAPKRFIPSGGDSGLIRSVNGQLTWDTAARRMLVAAPRSVGVVGSVRPGETINLGVVRIIPGATRQNWATINATVIEGADFMTARRILITATGMCENTGQRWKDAEKSSVGSDWGSAPSLVEGVAATINLPAMRSAKAWALDERGERRAEVPLTQATGGAQLELSSEHQTLWWEIALP